MLDLTSGGGSIPFEALRLGGRVIANELNPVAATILSATLQYPAEFGVDLAKDIERWGCVMLERVSQKMEGVTPFSPLPREELEALKMHCANCPELLPQFSGVEFDQTGVLYCRQVTCPHCGGDAPLLNTCWLAKGDGEKWGVALHTDGAPTGGTVSFAPYRLHKGKGPHGEDPSRSTVKGGVGQCIHCGHAIEAEEIKRQARGESPHGTWKDVLYTVAAVRYQPKLDSKGNPQRYKSGAKAGEIRTEKIRFFWAPTAQDLEALRKAEEE
ncbi:MAG TPA: hypothetical protein PLA80_14070, partial [Synergistaceae bacterium]|nr:hypothetical protein [Synergistaceae bacterium]